MAVPDSENETPTIDHPLLESGILERRLYQLQLAGTAATDHTLVCLPTGLGKTTVSLLVTARRLEEVGGKSLMLAPTKPLVSQHAEFYREALAIPDEEIVVFTGDVSPEDRAETWEAATIVMATPQVIENDLVGSRISLADVTHCTFDECHRATGDYAYNYIAERYHDEAENPLVTGMSASPGGDEEAILEVCENLGIGEVEVMTEEDADVAEYTHETDLEWERIELPEEVIEIRDALNEVIRDRLEKLKELGIADSTQPDQSQKELNAMRGELQRLIGNDQSKGYEGMSIHAEVMKLRQAVTLVETQSVEALRRYFERQRNQARTSGASKASQRMVSDPRVREAMRKAESFDQLHPKYRKTRMLLAETLGLEDGERVIVFTESRDTAEALSDFLAESVDVRRFVGQGDRDGSDGMTQNEQQEVLEQFRAGEFEVLVSTSVAEEGLDVPEVDLVLFYEPVPTAIRSIQRKGRTGRQSEGRVVVLMAEDTRDEAYFWISRRREKEMESELRELKGMADDLENELDESQRSLAAFESGAKVNDDDGKPGDGSEVSSGTEGVAGQPGLQAFADVADEESTEGDDEPASLEDEPPVASAEGETIEVVADQREMDADIARELSRRDEYEVRLETLAVGDYVLSDRVVVERKSVADFVDSLVGGDRSLFEQVGDMARHYSRPIVVVEGEDIYEQRDVHPNAVRGALSSLAVDFGASVLRTESEADTTELLAVIAGREQDVSGRDVSVHGEKGTKTLGEQQEYVVASIAEIGPVTARSLLTEFGSVEAVMIASEEELQNAEGVGEVTAERIREVVGSDYTC
ncbi:DEAD/DEAH box helicase [Natrialbaceae archaeon AArc-T1-2]|uniref:DEAD/DEAH box helicase n=1 Tax=Natrialbaceae archaeon AArc-T1-2 TaxID=3053904 RepID=UPI00255B0922|nr:DEAD/DEAH box helicase [Natrialbaceae archaeon AArc-T1-2]WIV65654.1 DEAD/DEAH box helicase [Natrialbaceae archaeon AArc-T1-2]